MASEQRLIDANVWRHETCVWCNEHYPDDPCEPSDCPAMQYIDNFPTVDSVEVVPCKECKHRGHILRCPMCFEEQYEFDEGDGYMCTDYRTYDRTKDNGYCDRGERKDNG